MNITRGDQIQPAPHVEEGPSVAYLEPIQTPLDSSPLALPRSRSPPRVHERCLTVPTGKVEPSDHGRTDILTPVRIIGSIEGWDQLILGCPGNTTSS